MTCGCDNSDGHMKVLPDCGCGCRGRNQEKKLAISALAAIMFFIVANPATYELTRNIFGSWVGSADGCPSMEGLSLHTLVFLLLTWLSMNVSK